MVIVLAFIFLQYIQPGMTVIYKNIRMEKIQEKKVNTECNEHVTPIRGILCLNEELHEMGGRTAFSSLMTSVV